MGMFDYCSVNLHNIDGKEITSFHNAQTYIEGMMCNYRITEHGVFYKGFTRLRNTSLNIITEHGKVDILLKFNKFGVVYYLEFRTWNGCDWNEPKCSTIRKDWVKKWNWDNLKEDLLIYPTRFKDTTYLIRLITLIRFKYWDIKCFLKYDCKKYITCRIKSIINKLKNLRK